jgi:hypothetical protein
VVQWGLATTGPNANPDTVDQLGAAVVTTPEPASLVLVALAGLLVRRR